MERQDVDTFLNFLAREKGCSRNTLDAYRNDLTQMLDFFLVEGIEKLDSDGDNLVMSFLLKLREKGYSPSTVARKVASMKSFFRFMLDSGRLKMNPSRNLLSPQVNKHMPECLSEQEYQRLLAGPARLATPEARRDVVMLELLYSTGLRVGELVALNTADIDLKQYAICCVHGNGVRRIPFDPRIGKLLDEYFRNARLDLLYNEREEALFLNRRGGRLTRQGFWQIVKSYAIKAGLETKVTPHILRHSFAINKLNKGVRIQSVQHLLGHAYLSSTRVYKQV